MSNIIQTIWKKLKKKEKNIKMKWLTLIEDIRDLDNFLYFLKTTSGKLKKNAIANFIVLSSIDDNLYTFISLNYLIKWEKRWLKMKKKIK